MGSLIRRIVCMNKSGFVAAALLLMVSVVPTQIVKAQDMAFSATECMPVSLQQAINRGLAWTQFGVQVVGTLSTFVVCPVSVADVPDSSFDFTVRLEGTFNNGPVFFPFPAPAETTCSLFQMDRGNTSPSNNGVEEVISLTPLVDPQPGLFGYPIEATSSTDVTFSDPFFPGDDTMVVVCELAANSSLAHYQVTVD